MRVLLTVIVGINPRFQFVRTEQAVWFRDGTLAMDPFRFNGVQPRAFAGQGADHDAHALSTPLDLLIVLAYPVPYGMTAVPGGIVPDQQQSGKALTGRPETNRSHIWSSWCGPGRTSSP